MFLEISQKIREQKTPDVSESPFNKVSGLRPAALLKRDTLTQLFPVNFAKFLRTRFSLHRAPLSLSASFLFHLLVAS